MIEELYNPSEIEPKWQKRWQADGLYRAQVDPAKPKHYALTMLPYPSGNLHIGHWYAMTPSDAHARFMRMNGYNVLFPMGFDAFGLPAENAAIRDGIHPMIRTYKNIDYMREQLRSMGAMFDWEREAISCDPEYYRWTQWFFIKLFEAGLAYKKLAPVDWCPHCNTTLAREQVWGDDRHCERCGMPVIKKDLDQWYFRTTNYAEELLSFEGMDWPQMVMTMQTNWIGRSEGANVTFYTEQGDPLEVFTTRPDTLFGATFMVLAPEHPLVEKLTTPEYRAAVEAYIAESTRQTEIARLATDKEKTGVFIGAYAINPVNEARIPIWIADYVMMTYGTGAIMAVPAHDARDFAFARKFNLPVVVVIQPPDAELEGETMAEAWDGGGTVVNSGPWNGTPADKDAGQSVKVAIEWLAANGKGKGAVTYRLRDWLISRQRYWGSPIPIVYCQTCGQVAVPDDQLPVTLPADVEWLPTGQSPLKLHPTWSKTTCPKCGAPAERDTDTMDTFMCSSWYHLRYLSPKDHSAPFTQSEYDYWMPVDTYTGGAEHATMHLIYTRFFHKAGRDMGILKGNEPMLQLRNQGQILGPDGVRMSKSRGNVIDPDAQVRVYGADTVRAYLMFAYRWAEGGPWSDLNIQGPQRWLRRLWTLFRETANVQPQTDPAPNVLRALRRKVHQTAQKVTRDFENFEFNTIVAALMELLNEMYTAREAGAVGSPEWREAQNIYLRLLAPICPHIAEELWVEALGEPYSVHTQAWVQADAEASREDEVTLAVQVNGKVRERIIVPADADEATVTAAAQNAPAIAALLEGRTPRKVIYVPGKLVNIVA